MGLLSQTDFHALVDRLQGRVAAAVLDSAEDMLLGNTQSGLATYLMDDLGGDPNLQAALLSIATDVDRQALGDNLYTYLQDSAQIGVWRSLLSVIQNYVKSADGGGHATFGAYLAAVSGSFHPVIAELLGSSAYIVSSSPVGAIHPQMTHLAFDRVYEGAPTGVLNDVTTAAGAVGGADVDFFDVAGDVVVLQARRKFCHILCNVGTLGAADPDMTVTYWNGDSWVAVAGKVDNTVGFSVNDGLISFTMPDDWEPTARIGSPPAAIDATQQGEFYTVMLTHVTGLGGPQCSWFRYVPEAVESSANRLYGMVDQPPLALIHITGTDACTVTVIQNPDYTKFVPPGTTNDVLKAVALCAPGADVTITLRYTNESNVASLKAQSNWVAPAAGATKVMALDTDDYRVRGILSTTSVVTAATEGVIAIIADGYSRSIGAK